MHHPTFSPTSSHERLQLLWEQPPWDPERDAFHATILHYEPGHLLRYEQNKDWSDAGLLLLASLLLGWLAGALFGAPRIWISMALLLSGGYTLYQWKSGSYNTLLWEIDWHSQTLTIQARDETFHYDLRNATEVILQLEAQPQWWSSSLSGLWTRYRYTRFNAHILLRGLLPESDLELGQTGPMQQDKEEVLQMGLRFAQMLSENLQLPLTLEEINTNESALSQSA